MEPTKTEDPEEFIPSSIPESEKFTYPKELLGSATQPPQKAQPSPPEDSLLSLLFPFPIRLLFEWMTPLLVRGFARGIKEEDIPRLSRRNQIEKNSMRFDKLFERLKGKKLALILTLVLMYGFEFIAAGTIAMLSTAGQTALPFFMNAFLKQFKPLMTSEDQELYRKYNEILPQEYAPSSYGSDYFGLYRTSDYHVWIWLACLCTCGLIYMLCAQIHYHFIMQTAMKVRGLLITKIYQKSLRISQKTRAEFDAGKVISILTVDTENVYRAVCFTQTGIYSFAVFIVCVIYLIILIDWGTLTGFSFVILCIPFLMLCFILLNEFEKKKNVYRDKRVNVFNEVLMGIKIVKFFAWEGAYIEKIEKIRKAELRIMRVFSVVMSVMVSFFISLPVFIASVAFSTYYLIHRKMDPVTLFTCFSFFGLLRDPLMTLPGTVVGIIQFFQSTKRIEKFLNSEEIEEYEILDNEKVPIEIENGVFGWEKSEEEKKKNNNNEIENNKMEKKSEEKNKNGKKKEEKGIKVEVEKKINRVFNVFLSVESVKKEIDTLKNIKCKLRVKKTGFTYEYSEKDKNEEKTNEKKDDDTKKEEEVEEKEGEEIVRIVEEEEEEKLKDNKEKEGEKASYDDTKEGKEEEEKLKNEENKEKEGETKIQEDENKTSESLSYSTIKKHKVLFKEIVNFKKISNGNYEITIIKKERKDNDEKEEKFVETKIYINLLKKTKEFEEVISNLNIKINGLDNKKDKDSPSYSYLIKDINFSVRKGELIIIVGKVGSGKSTLISSILGGTKNLSGNRKISAKKIGYCSQNPWIKNDTLLNNILFGSDFKKEKLEKIIDCCCLKEDLEQLKGGLMIEIGERGTTLSGGQKTRVSLARACYEDDSDLIILDDPFSAVDVHVGGHIFRECIMGILKDKTRVIVTHDLSLIKYADRIYVMENGRICENGTYSELMDKKKDEGILRRMIEKYQIGEKELKKKDEKEIKKIVDLNESGGNPNEMELKKNEEIQKNIMVEENKKIQGNISLSVIFFYIQKLGICNILIVALLLIVSQSFYTAFQWFLSEWSNQSFIRTYGDQLNNVNYYVYKNESNTSSVTYHMWNSSLFNGTECKDHEEFECYCENISLFWSDYKNDTVIQNGISNFASMGIYVCLGIVFFILAAMKETCFYVSGIKGSKKIHQKSLKSVIFSPQSFFDVSKIGWILTKFTTDLSITDNYLITLISLFLTLFAASMIGGIMIGIATSGVFIVVIIILVPIYFVLYFFFRKSSLPIKRLNATTYSKLVSFCSESCVGMSTLRAYKKVDSYNEKMNEFINKENSVLFMNNTAMKWLHVRLSLLGVSLTVLICIYSICCYYYIPSGTAGWIFNDSYISLIVSLSMEVNLVMYNCISKLIELEKHFNSVERFYSFAKQIKMEKRGKLIPLEDGKKKKMENWPDKGEIKFEKFFLKYREELEFVLKGISMEIKEKEKIGICGRTGSGKSSIINSIFRIVDPETCTRGELFIDDVNVKCLDVDTLRKNLSIIPQDPVLFSGTVRSNLDPFEEFSDEEIWNCLKKCFMDERIKDLGDEVQEKGQNFSVGQRQLLCLGRAILRNSKILIMDECTANVDYEIDSKIQNTIRKFFVNSTVLTIAHRINTIIDSDKILVLEDGKIKEFDTPQVLIEKRESLFSKLVREESIDLVEKIRKKEVKNY